MDTEKVLFWLLVALQLYSTDCLECYSCTNVSHVASCLTTITCPPGQMCHTAVVSNTYTLGCKDNGLCPNASTSHHVGAGQIIGRALTTGVSVGCSECCSTGLCNRQLCPNTVNGGWSEWLSWGSCSVTCGIGLQPRDRTCSNPYPSNSGLHCFGESHGDRICLARACQDGGWTDWNGWTTCSKTCDTGTRKRSRACTNPPPSVLGRYCMGDNSETETCSAKPCQGCGYNTTTGQFTCSVAGAYSFSLTILKKSTAKAAYCSIYKNTQRLGQADVSDSSHANAYVPGSVTVYVHLQPGDIVSLQSCSSAYTMYGDEQMCIFTGYLIHSD